MIEPRMATMLGYLTTDAEVEPGTLRRALVEASRDTFNAITVDGESSTNDCVFALAIGEAAPRADRRITLPRPGRGPSRRGARPVARIVRGGEGATKLMSITVSGAASDGRGVNRRARHRQLAARQNGDPRRRSQLGPSCGCRRPIRRDLRARQRDRSHWNARPLQRRSAARPSGARRPRATCGQGDRNRGQCRRRRHAATPRSTPATCRLNT